MLTAALLHAFFTCAMTGLIWFVQVCHYPLFAMVGAEAFQAFEEAYTRSTTLIIVPLMLGELGAALWLTFGSAAAALRPLAWWGLALLAVIWLSTFLVQVPLHEQLMGGFDPVVHLRLVRSNWIRTLAWSGRAALALAMIPRSMPPTHSMVAM